ncbi:PP2C family protein-serine/threonine phosphatase [Polycyclovorans algicola]|uniref:PP2C family protein-serine/threonine phosphatase n=1 Tax=Polycyclovorans algicola TaxID=616992 RepID=UPI0004A73FD5|nr:protein phosphatase 2C domain-containing protein [Polycyclovorans algicola]
MRTATVSDIGLHRERNEDAFLVSVVGKCTLALVADGVGGRGNGAFASAAAREYFSELIRLRKLNMIDQQPLRDALIQMAVHTLHTDVVRRSAEDENCRGMACTLTLVIADSVEYTLYQVGDSRLYHRNSNGLNQISVDQTLSEEMFKAGRISSEQRATHPDRHTLSQAIGVAPMRAALQPAVTRGQWTEDDILLLCSDGLSGMVRDEAINAIFQEHPEPETAAEALRQAALEAGGKDNITVVIMQNRSPQA